MALTESIEYDKIEIVGEYRNVQVRQATVIKKDGKEITRSFHRYILHPGHLNESNEFIDTDLSAQPDDVKSVCTALWTTDIKNAFKAFLIENKEK